MRVKIALCFCIVFYNYMLDMFLFIYISGRTRQTVKSYYSKHEEEKYLDSSIGKFHIPLPTSPFPRPFFSHNPLEKKNPPPPSYPFDWHPSRSSSDIALRQIPRNPQIIMLSNHLPRSQLMYSRHLLQYWAKYVGMNPRRRPGLIHACAEAVVFNHDIQR